MRYLLLSVLIATLYQYSFGQSANPMIGPRSAGLGYSSACLSDGWAVFNNIAGLAEIKSAQAGMCYELVSGFPSFNRAAFYLATPLPIGAASIGTFRFGDALYNEQSVTAGYANKFGIAALGISGHYLQYYTEGFGQKSVLSFSFGGIATLTPWLKFGAHIKNLSQPKISADEKLSTSMTAGLCVNASSNVLVMLEAEKLLEYKPNIKAGIEYAYHKKFSARTGINVNPQAAFFGFGFSSKKCNVDYAFTWLNQILSMHQVSIVYNIKKKK